MNRWPEYNAGTLPLPAVVQHDTLASGTSLVWVATDAGIYGPYSRSVVDLDELVGVITYVAPPEYSLECEDGSVVNV